jgi:hypothetical protein
LRINIKAVGIGIALAVGLSMAPGAEAGGRIPSTVPQFGLYLQESFDLNIEPDNFYANADSGDSNKILRCIGAKDPICTASTNVMIIHNIPVCSVDARFDCIKELWAIDPSGKRIDGQYQTALPVSFDGNHDGYPSMLISAARGFGGLWKIPGVLNSAGLDTYFVSARLNSGVEKKSGSLLEDHKIYYGQFFTGIIPVQRVAGDYRPMASRPTWGRLNAPRDSGPKDAPDGTRCTVVDTGFCEVPVDFPDGYRFGMSVQMAQSISGWWHGRIALPSVNVTPSQVGQLVSIEAEPVRISTLDFMIPTEKVPDSVKKAIFADVDWGIMGSPETGMQTMLNGLSEPSTMEIMSAMLPVIGDKATKTTQYWSYRALNAWRNPEVQKCSGNAKDLGGVVTTNALTYSAGPPTYDKANGTLDYKVASPHFESSGKVALGTYDLVIRSSVARCIYGFSNAPISATISIVGESGEQKVATTVINERNGFLYLSAKGFTFSAPTVRVKLSQEATTKPVATKSTITCVKGKVSKKVTGSNPKCPSGYKKK